MIDIDFNVIISWIAVACGVGVGLFYAVQIYIALKKSWSELKNENNKK